jgi:hypothetical protein
VGDVLEIEHLSVIRLNSLLAGIELQHHARKSARDEHLKET